MRSSVFHGMDNFFNLGSKRSHRQERERGRAGIREAAQVDLLFQLNHSITSIVIPFVSRRDG